MRLAAIADDYTGASDLANTWAKAGLATVQTIGVPDGLDVSGAEALVVSLKIRSVPAAEAVEAATQAWDWLQARGFGHVMYKICSTFDSTDAGNIGPVTAALCARAGAALAPVTPAFPETGRTVYKGHLFVEDVLLSESSLRTHPLNPMHDANLVRVLARQMADPVALLDLATIRTGDAAIARRLAALAGQGARAVIADAVAEPDLEALGRAALAMPVSIGASGLGLGLARGVVAGGALEAAAPVGSPTGPTTGPSAILVGSCSARSLEQVAVAARGMPVLRLDADALVTSGGDTREALAWALARLDAGPVLVAASGDPAAVAAVQARHGRAAASAAIEAGLAALAEGLVAAGVTRLVVAGGETSGAVVDRLGIAGFRVGPEIAPGVPALTTLGRARPLAMALKSGNFGGADFFERALGQL
ncbi:MAG: four-carbon acid sugar kinase family protein [Amaricoccus sp.]|uniref:3-oxo-tetronate kinase n=1 Tax=Amaricoccus sp. TaxID=1872485 RepID=UPI0039E51F36